MKPMTLEIDETVEIYGPTAPIGLYPVGDLPAAAGHAIAEPAIEQTSVGVTSVAEASAVDASAVEARPVEPIADGAESGAAGVAAPENGATGFVALSKFEIANGMIDEVRTAFRNRPHLVDGAPGFLRMDVISPVEAPAEIWLITYWTDEASYRSWHRSHVYRESHGGIPKGLKLRPQGTELRYFDHVCS